MSTASDGRYAPPTAHVEDVAASNAAGTLAGRGSRLGAAIVDVLIAVLGFGLLALLTPFNLFAPDPSRNVFAMLVTNLVLGFIFFLLVHGYLIATRGQTVGKMLLKIRIVRRDGARASFGRIVGLRYLTTSVITSIPFIGMLYGLVDALFIFSASRRCLHDLIADTIVVTA